MAKRWDVVATIRYTRDNEEKKQYIKCGAAWEGDKGMRVKIDSLPTHSWDGWLNFYEPKAKDDAPKSRDDGDLPPF